MCKKASDNCIKNWNWAWELDCFLLAVYYNYKILLRQMILYVYDMFHNHNPPGPPYIIHIILETKLQ